jgi:hypothetical protein
MIFVIFLEFKNNFPNSKSCDRRISCHLKVRWGSGGLKMKLIPTITLALLATLSATATAQAAMVVSYEGEAPGMQNTSAAFSFEGVETFDAIAAGSAPSTYSHIFTDAANPATTITMNFTGGPKGLQINNADQYGGAGGSGNYVVAFNATPFTLDLSSTNVAGGVNYFGYWLSALDAGNVAKFYGDQGQLLFTFNPKDVLNVVTAKLQSGQYYGNPNAAFTDSGTGVRDNNGEPYVFLNFFSTGGAISKVEFEEAPTYGGGYESDNYTVGHYLDMGTSTPIPTPLSLGLPEPATWAMLLMGFGAVGYAMRKRGPVSNRHATIAFA